jgi:hypothetical protein
MPIASHPNILFRASWFALVLFVSSVCMAVGLFIIVAGVVAFYLAVNFDLSRIKGLFGSEYYFLVLFPMIFFAPFGKRLCNTGWRMMIASAVRVNDPRPPVLYLRSFSSDSKLQRFVNLIPTGNLYIDFMANVTLSTEEEDIAAILSRVGPPIAVGRPGEKLPTVGMTKLYVPDDQWRHRVRELISQAALVVIRAGPGPFLLWEIQTAMNILNPEQLLFLIPFGEEFERGNAYCPMLRNRPLIKFQEELQRLLPCDVPLLVGMRVKNVSTIGLLYFERNWTPHFIELSQLHPWHDWRTRNFPELLNIQKWRQWRLRHFKDLFLMYRLREPSARNTLKKALEPVIATASAKDLRPVKKKKGGSSPP